MKAWVAKSVELLRASLVFPRHELNELDWKGDLSSNKSRLAEHLSAFANQAGGGFLVFGVDAEGNAKGVNGQDVESIVNQLANIGRSSLEPPLLLDHTVEEYDGVRLLFVHVAESGIKPVHLRGRGLEDAFIRSAGTTRKASRQEIGTMMLNSRTPRWEELRASLLLSDEVLIEKLNVEPIFRMIERPIIKTPAEMLEWLSAEGFVDREPVGGGYVTNLGGIATARDLNDFPDLGRKAIRLIVYEGVNKVRTRMETEWSKGYAVSFQQVIELLMTILPQSEVIEHALREKKTVYPEIALREIIANALIHQDFTVSGAGPLIEVFSDRIEISNPGGLLPSKRLDRLIGTQPESRNERLARAFRRYKICEERGSGLLKAGLEVELYGLPPLDFIAGDNHFKVVVYSPRTFAEMSQRERLHAAQQHAILKHLSGSVLTNTSLRERLKMPEKQRSMVSLLIQEAVDEKLIKSADPENKSKKFAEYVPIWA
jgi:predicted HTH transcriptional regulator